MSKRYVLGIETSCDDTAAAVVTPEGEVLSSVRISQDAIHAQFGGVFPEYASRAHIFNILPVVDQAIREAGVPIEDLEAIGVTNGPGLVGSLLVGINTASALGMAWNKEVYAVNHLRGHIRSVNLEGQEIEYPSLLLLISGGHTIMGVMKTRDDFEVIGQTRDDSLGEAYDKVGRMIGLAYPAGRAMDDLTAVGETSIQFPTPLLRDGYEFSFSGLKSSVRRYLEKNTEYKQADIAASFSKSVVTILRKKTDLAIKEFSPKSLVVVGGVAASPVLRAMFREICEAQEINLRLPPIKWSTDNAAMIALATYDYIDKGIKLELSPRYRVPVNDY